MLRGNSGIDSIKLAPFSPDDLYLLHPHARAGEKGG